MRLAAAGNLAGAEERVRLLLRDFPEYGAAQVHLARVLLARGRQAEADAVLEKLLVSPGSLGGLEVDAWLLLAESKLHAGQFAQAETNGRRALALAPEDARASFAVAMACQRTGRFDEAQALYAKGLRIQPAAVHAWVNKGLVEKQLGRLNQAITSFEEALKLNPAIAPAHYSLGLIHLLRGARADAERSLRNALSVDPRHIHAASQLATLLRYENRIDEATDIYRAILRYAPDDAMARFHVDAAHQPGGPERIPPDVVQAIYADEAVGRNLEKSLQDRLKYQTPAILQATLQEIHGPERAVLDVLDLGCGSGLYGALIRPRAKRLVGVDLSAAMIAECGRKAVYHDLQVKDVLEYLAATPERFDLIVAMDVLCYFGDLRPLLQGCAGVLRPGAILACSVERASVDEGWQFHRYGHFVHSAAHLRDGASAAGMREVRITECALRREFDEDRIGYVALFTTADNS